MKPPRLLALILLLSGLTGSASAQLVHFSFSDFDGFFLWKANDASAPWNQTLGNIYQFDLYYDVATATPEAPGAASYTFSDPSRNFWQLKVTGPKAPKVFTVAQPLSSLNSSAGYLFFSSSTGSWLNFSATFDGGGLGEGLPLPPLTNVSGSIDSIFGGSDWFPYPQMGEGYGYGTFLSGRAEVVPYVGFRAVPEPAAYGLGGLVVLGLVAVRRRLRLQTTPQSG